MKNEYGATVVSQYDYVYDNIGRRNSMTTSGDAFSVSLPVPPNQKLVNTGTYTSVGYSANDLNQYTSVDTDDSAVSPAYDNDGGLTDDGTFTYTWNGENRLIEATPKNPAVGDEKLAFYDYMGRRVRKVTTAWDGSTWQADETRFFVYYGWNLIEELDGTGATIASYIHGLDLSQSLQGAGGIGGILARVDHGTDKVHLYFYDANGNVGQLLDSSDGSVVAAYEYEPFGGLTSSMGSYAEINPFRFSSKYADGVTGLYYYGYRYYSPELGRWLSRDPVGEEGGINLYGFVGNDGVNNSDYLGKFNWPCFAACWIGMPEDEFIAMREEDISKLSRNKRRQLERQFYKKHKDKLKGMTRKAAQEYKRTILKDMAREKGINLLQKKAKKKFGKVVGGKVATWLAGTGIGAAAGAPAGGVGAAPGAAIGAIVSTGINIVSGVGDVWEICKCAWKCK